MSKIWKLHSKKGFTLAELLVVVAIIAVLVAVAIPVFTGQTDKAKASTDMANIRSGYADAMTKVIDGTLKKGDSVLLKADGTTDETGGYECRGDQADVTDQNAMIGTQPISDIGWVEGDSIKYTVNDEGGIDMEAVQGASTGD